MNRSLHETEDTERAAERFRVGAPEARRWTEAFLAGENRVLEMIAKGRSLPTVLDALCRLVEEICTGSLCSILLLDENEDRLRHGAAPSLPESYTAAIDGRSAATCWGPCGMAVYRKEPVVISDSAAEAQLFECCDLLVAHGLRACWSTPIFSSDGSVLGTFAIYWREPRRPNPQDNQIIEQTTHVAAVAIERKRTEAALQSSEERFRRMADAIPEVIWFTALQPEKVLYVSPSFERIWGFPIGELYRNPRRWTEAIHPEDRDRVASTFSKWIAGAKVDYHDVEYRIMQPGGGTRWIHERGVLSLNEQGQPYLASGISTDITQRKRTEDELRRSEAYLAEAQRLSLTGSFGGRVTSGEFVWSAETFCILGYDRTVTPALELVFKRVHPEDISFVKEAIESAVRGRTNLDFEHRLLMPDGALKHVHIMARATQSESGDMEFVGAVMDITERKRAAEALREAEHLARGQLDALAHTLDSMAKETDPDKLLEHALRAIIERSGAQSVSVWVRVQDSNLLDRIAVIEDGRFLNIKNSNYPAIALPNIVPDHPVWSDILRTRQHAVLQDIEAESAQMHVGSDANSYRVLEDTDPNPAIVALKKYLRGLGVRTILFVPMLIAGEVAGIVGIRFTQKRFFHQEDIELTRALAHQAMLAIQLTRLSQESREAAVMAERNRMARDIHDTLAQGFTGVIMQLEAVKGAIGKNDLAQAINRIERAGDLARAGLREARRSVLALRPHSLQDATLCMALDDLLKRMTDGSGLQAEFHLEGDEPVMPAEWEAGLLRVAQESLTNTIKHARARNFRATLTIRANEIQFRLVDDGVGFDLHAEHEGFGLVGMKERVDQMGGQFILRSVPGQGTEIQIILRNLKTRPNGGEHA